MSSEPAADSVYGPSQNAAYRCIAGEVVIVDTAAGKMLSLNETGSAIWELLGSRTLSEIAHALTRQFHIGETAALEEVVAFISMLSTRGLVERRNPQVPASVP